MGLAGFYVAVFVDFSLFPWQMDGMDGMDKMGK